MRTALLFIIITLLPSTCLAAMDVGVSIDDGELKSFYLAVGDYYKVPEREVYSVRERVPEDDLPVVFFIASRARVSASAVIDLRLGGSSWFDISARFGLDPSVFYVPLPSGYNPGPPYGKAYGYYKKRPRSEWNKIVLKDDEVVNFVNLRFISDYYSISVSDVISDRGKGMSFRDIHGKSKSRGKGSGPNKDKPWGKDKGTGKGKDKGKNK